MQFSNPLPTTTSRKQKILSGQPEGKKSDTNPTEKKRGCQSLSFDATNLFSSTLKLWAEQLSRYSDWLRAGRSGDRMPVQVRCSAPVQTGPGTHPASCTMGTGCFPGVKTGRGVTLTPHPLLVPLVMKEQSYASTPPMGHMDCTEPQCLYKGALDLYFFTLKLSEISGCMSCESVCCGEKEELHQS